MKKIAFMGADPIALPLLDYLASHGADEYKIVGIISQPDRPSGRGQKVHPNPISAWALEKNLPLFRPQKPSEVELNWLKEEQVDLVLVMAYGHILKEDFLKTPPLGMLNFHASLLPAYRGASPIETAIACGDTETGISLMEMVKKMDAGSVMDQEKVSIDERETSTSLREKLSQACVPLIQRNLPTILSGKASFEPQDESIVSYTRKIKKEDGWLNFNAPAKELERRIRALTPWPGAVFKFQDITIKIGSAEVTEAETSAKPGTIVSDDQESLVITTGKHLNWIDGGMPLRKHLRITGPEFEQALSDIMLAMETIRYPVLD